MTETDVPALELSFLATGTAQEKQIQDGDDEVLGKLKQGLRKESTSAKRCTVQELSIRSSELMDSFERTGNPTDMLEAISVDQQVVLLTPDGHPDKPRRMNNLGLSLQWLFECTGNVSCLEEAISFHQRAVQLTPDGHEFMPVYLNNLGASFNARFERTGNLSDLWEAISNLQRTVQLTPNAHPIMSASLNNLASLLRRCFERTGNLSDLLEAISIQQRAVQITPNGHPDMPGRLNAFGGLLHDRFERTGDRSDLSEAISNQQKAVQLTPDDHPDMPTRLTSLGNSFRSRFEHTGNLSDLLEAISNQQRAVQLTPNGHPDMPGRLNNLGGSLHSRFKRAGDYSDLSEVISNQQQVVQLTPDGHPNMSVHLSNLGLVLNSRFLRLGNLADISEAISNQQRAVQLTPEGHPGILIHLNNLGISFYSRFGRTGDLSDISEAISNLRRAVQLTPDGHPEMLMRLSNLGHSFQRRFKHTANRADICTAASTFQKCATTFGVPSIRFKSARQWAKLSMAHNLPYTLTAYGIAIDLISEIAGMDSTIEQRHTHLIDISTVTTSAASAAFTLGEAQKALEWLEQGRCLVWSQLNQLRTPLDHLRAHDEHLAQQFSDISGGLEASGSRSGSGGLNMDAPLSQKIGLQEEAHRHVILSRQWSELLDEIRSIPQFHSFLRPPQTSELMKRLPRDGIVILVNVHKARCDALALVFGSEIPIHITLDDFTRKEASDLRKRLRRFLSSHRVRMREADRGGRPTRRPDSEKQSELHFVLEALWLHVVRPILDGLAFSVSFSQSILDHFVDIFP